MDAATGEAIRTTRQCASQTRATAGRCGHGTNSSAGGWCAGGRKIVEADGIRNMSSTQRQPLNEVANESFGRTMSYCYECLTDLHPHYACVECAGCGFLL